MRHEPIQNVRLILPKKTIFLYNKSILQLLANVVCQVFTLQLWNLHPLNTQPLSPLAFRPLTRNWIGSRGRRSNDEASWPEAEIVLKLTNRLENSKYHILNSYLDPQ